MSKFNAAVYDPSEKVSQDRWIWKNCPTDVSWENLRGLISANENLSGDIVTGIAAYPDYDGLVCIFRRYRIGLDAFGRPGRYFLALVKITKKSDLLDEEATNFFNSIEKQLDFSVRQKYVRLNPDAFRWAKADADSSQKDFSGDPSIIRIYKAFDIMKGDWALWGTSPEHELTGILKLSPEDTESHDRKPFGKSYGKKIVREGGDTAGKQSSPLLPQALKGCLGSIAISFILLIVVLLALFIVIKKCGGPDVSTQPEIEKSIPSSPKKGYETTPPDDKTTYGTEGSGKMEKLPDAGGSMKANQPHEGTGKQVIQSDGNMKNNEKESEQKTKGANGNE